MITPPKDAVGSIKAAVSGTNVKSAAVSTKMKFQIMLVIRMVLIVGRITIRL